MALTQIQGSGISNVTISADGEVTKAAQPAFSASPATTQSNIPINTFTDIVFGTENYDVGANFASNTFTAPVSGKYQLSFQIYALAIDEDSAYVQMLLDTSNRNYFQLFDPGIFDQECETFTFILSILADMGANDTAKISLYQQGGTAQVDISTASFFTGALIC